MSLPGVKTKVGSRDLGFCSQLNHHETLGKSLISKPSESPPMCTGGVSVPSSNCVPLLFCVET